MAPNDRTNPFIQFEVGCLKAWPNVYVLSQQRRLKRGIICNVELPFKDILKWGEDNFHFFFVLFEGLLKTPEDN